MRWIAKGATFGGALILAGMTGCGGGSGGNDDQGVVFLATGIFRGQESIEQGRVSCVVPSVSSSIIDASFNLNIAQVQEFPDRADALADPCGGFIGLQNNLISQGINVQEVSIRYEVPGAAIAIPAHSVSFGQRIGQPSDDPASNVIFAAMVGQIVPSTIIVFLNQNVNRLPATPYLMSVFLAARGQSDDGTTYETNEIGYQLTITR